MMNIVILFIFLVSLGILFFNYKRVKSDKQWHKHLVSDYENKIDKQMLKKENLKSPHNSLKSNIVFQQLDIIKQQIALLEVISNVNNQ